MKAVYQWVLRTMMKDQTGVMQTLPKKDLVDFNVAMTAERLMRNGFDPNAFKNANQVENAINQIEAPRNVQQGIKSAKSAKVMDMEGKEIDPRSKIMGGKQAETEAEIAARMSKENKESAARIKNKKMLDDAIDNMSPSLSGDRKVDAELVAEDLAERMGKVYDDLPTKERLDLYDQAYQGLTKKKFDPPENMAQGGRAGFKSGLGKGFLNFLKGLTKEKPFSGKEFVDKRKFIGADKIENKINQIKNEKVLKEAQEEFKKNPPFKFPEPGSKEYEETLARVQRRLMGDRKLNADGGRIGLKDGPKLSDFVNVQASGSKSGKQQIMGAPEGITADRESINAIIKADIPISQKIDLLAKYQYGKGRTKIEKDDQELFLDEGGFKSRDIGLGFNKEGEGIGGTLMYNMETGEPEFNIGFRKKFDKGGMTRRTFLKLLGGLASIPIVGKILKPMKVGKTVTKVPIIKTDNVPGKPEWFDALVNKVIIEGDDVTKRFATAERQSIHQKTLDDGSVVRVTEDVDDGAVRVEYESDESMFQEPVQLQYKKPLPDEGDPRPAAEFEVSESGFVSRPDGPDDYIFEGEDMVGSSIRDLESDVSKLKQYATGQKQTLKEFVQSKKRKDKVAKLNEGDLTETNQYIADRQPEPDIDYGVDDYASGGIARMLGE